MNIDEISSPVLLRIPSSSSSQAGEHGPVEPLGRLEQHSLELERPSLQLQDVEGRIHKYEGILCRKTKRAKLKSGWKRRWFRVIPGKEV